MEDKGCLSIVLFFLWLGIVVGIPCLIFGKDVGLWATLAASFGLPLGFTISDHPGSKGYLAKELPFTYAHLWIFLAYVVIGIFTIGFTDKSYDAMKCIGKGALFYAILPVVVFFIEGFVKDKIEKKRRMEQRIIRLYQVCLSHESLQMYFQGKVERIVVEYKILYRSCADLEKKQGAFTKHKEDVANFYIECPNPKCTSGYIDLRGEILHAVKEWETSASGVITCCGKTAPDHPNQDCDVKIEYEILIQYA